MLEMAGRVVPGARVRTSSSRSWGHRCRTCTTARRRAASLYGTEEEPCGWWGRFAQQPPDVDPGAVDVRGEHPEPRRAGRPPLGASRCAARVLRCRVPELFRKDGGDITLLPSEHPELWPRRPARPRQEGRRGGSRRACLTPSAICAAVRSSRRHGGLVAEQGLDALTFGALEDRLAFTRGVITYHFAEQGRDRRGGARERDRRDRRRCARGGRGGADGGGQGAGDGARHGARLRRPGRGGTCPVLVLGAGCRRIPRCASSSTRPCARARPAAARRRSCAAPAREGEIGKIDPSVMASLLVGIVLGIAPQHSFRPRIDRRRRGDLRRAAHTVMARLKPPTARH